MKKVFLGWLVMLVTASCILAADEGQNVVKVVTGDLPGGAVVVIPLKGEVSQAQFFFLRRALKMGEAANARAYILDMDTPGGELGAAVEIMKALMKVDVPTYTYVNPNAGSAGALIALGTKHIWMAPVSAIGAAAPVMGGGQEIPETLSAKIVSYYSGYFRSAAENNGHNPDIAVAFINKDKEVKVGGKVISAEGDLLTLSAQEAVEKVGGKPLLADGLASSVSDLVEKAKLADAAMVEVEPSGFERMAIYITMLAPLFLLGGIIGTYMEFKTPGFGVPGAIAAVCFALFFAGHYVAGLTGLEVVAFFVLGFILVLIELLFIPGIVVLALAGVMLMFGSLLWAMVDYYPSAADFPSLDVLLVPMANLGIAVALSGIVMFFLAQFFPQLPFLRRMVLTRSENGDARGETALEALPVRAGDQGRALTALRPVGRAEIGGEVYDARTEGDFLAAGTPVVTLRVEGRELVVERGS
jgi:membrane-bound serine protease (ClpP class)